jgi:MFS transporter, OPA family, sugar phosphate sensor protein UhpC
MLTTWFASKERGTYWGLWNIAHNLGGFLAPIIAGLAAREFGWRWGMWVPGIMGVVMGFYVLLATADSPESKGYPPVEVLKPKKVVKGATGEMRSISDRPPVTLIAYRRLLGNSSNGNASENVFYS